MAELRKLLFSVAPHPAESLLSYLYRLAEENRYTRASWISSLARFSISEDSLNRVHSNFRKLAIVANVGVDELTPLLHYSDRNGNHTHVSLPTGEILSRKFLDWPSPRMCFYCTFENGFISRLWDFRCVSHCPVHGTEVTNVCPSCGEIATIDRGALMPCIPGCKPRSTGRTCSPETLGLMRLLSNKIVGTHYPTLRYKFPNDFLTGGVSEILQTISLIGQLIVYARSSGQEASSNIDWRAFSQIVDQISYSLAYWPRRLNQILQTVMPNTGRDSESVSVARDFGYLYRGVIANRESLQFVFDALLQHINDPVQERVLTGRGSPVILAGEDRRDYIPGQQARRKLSVGRAQLKHLYDWGYIQGKYFRTEYGETLWINRESLELYADQKQHLVGAMQLVAILGVCQNTIRSLRNTGVIPSVHGPGKDGWIGWRYDRRVVEGLISTLQEKACKLTSNNGFLSFKEAVAKFNKQGLSYGKLLAAIMNDVLSVYVKAKPSEQGLAKFRVREKQLVRWYGKPNPVEDAETEDNFEQGEEPFSVFVEVPDVR